MKKRDYYILGLLACLVVYASLNRNGSVNAKPDPASSKWEQSVNTQDHAAKPDSIREKAVNVIKAGV
ncbi:hypothetical protein [Gaoshiqia sp. Z1-71]|uniref:hypothetical protein n=1 Tax=Gaoshiqia hydrogeniformans TaxID=3290090 RepID=UPI003BF8385B